MNSSSVARTIPAATLAAWLAVSPEAGYAQRLGDHPAIVVQRLQAQQGYDYASKFYPHPAWLYLLAESPDALAARKREQQEAALQASSRTAGPAPDRRQ